MIPEPKPGRRRRTFDMREVLNAIFYLVANGIKWRAMTHDLPKLQSVYTYFLAWEADDTRQRLNSALRIQVRLVAGRNVQSDATLSRAQAVWTVNR